MREIKFRAWCDVCQKMILNPYSFRQHNDGLFYQCPNHEVHTQTAIMQYTGLKDKSGREIYEGDILAYQDPSMWSSCKAVEWNRWGAVNGWYLGNHGIPQNFNGEPIMVVVGNIHENPELLES